MEWISGNVFIRPNTLAKVGDRVDGHKHAFAHTTIVFRGAVHVRARLKDGTVREGEFKAPAHFLVLADVEHKITALEPDTEYWCVYAHRNAQGDVVEDFDGWMRAYG